MCGICGGFNVNVSQMLHVIRHRGPDGIGIFENGHVSIGHTLLSIVGTGKQPFYGCHQGFTVVCNGEIYNYKEIIKKLKEHKFQTTTDSEVIVHLIEENYTENLIDAVKKCMMQLDGDYAFAVHYRGEVVLSRDPYGVKPLYISDNCFSSERKSLRPISKKIATLKPGSIMSHGSEPKEYLNFQNYKRRINRPIEDLYEALTNSVEKRTRDLKVGLLFSGGIDSSLIAGIVDKIDRDAILYTVGMPGCKDFESVKEVADSFNSELIIKTIPKKKLVDYLGKVIYAIEDYNPMKVSIGVPIYVACEAIKNNGLKVALTGQGADELFAGYSRYLSMSKTKLEAELLRDISNIGEANLQRDDAVSMANSIELRLPYMDSDVIGIALALSVDLKINNGRRKYILKSIAKKMGLPESIINKSKKAIQYSSGVEKAIRSLAKQEDKNIEDYLKSIYLQRFPWR